jgi:hypothetical protein
LAEAVALARLEEAAGAGEAGRFLRPPESLLPDVPAVTVRPEAEDFVRNGRPLGPAQLLSPLPGEGPGPAPGLVRLLSAGGPLLALARRTPDGTALHPFLVLL